jgi:hypothetical protein
MDDSEPFVIESPTRIRLGPVAKEWAREFGLSLTDMAKHLLNQHRLEQGGQIQRPGED